MDLEQNVIALRKHTIDRRSQPTTPVDPHRGPRNAQGTSVSLEANMPVIAGSDLNRSVWMVKSGLLRLQRHGQDGKRQILSLILPGEIVGYESNWREGLSIETATRCELCRCDRREYDARLESDPVLRRAFYLQQQDQLERLRWLTWSIGALRPEERLSAFFALAIQFMPWQPLPDGTGVLTILLPRADIADLLATTVETISRFLHRLDGAGVVRIEDPSHLRLLDLQDLRARGCIEQSFDRLSFGNQRHAGLRGPLAICAGG
jgi:CRP-like cAMP-binding protein